MAPRRFFDQQPSLCSPHTGFSSPRLTDSICGSFAPSRISIFFTLSERRWPRPTLYSRPPGASAFHWISILAPGLSRRYLACASTTGLNSSLMSYLSNSKYTERLDRMLFGSLSMDIRSFCLSVRSTDATGGRPTPLVPAGGLPAPGSPRPRARRRLLVLGRAGAGPEEKRGRSRSSEGGDPDCTHGNCSFHWMYGPQAGSRPSPAGGGGGGVLPLPIRQVKQRHLELTAVARDVRETLAVWAQTRRDIIAPLERHTLRLPPRRAPAGHPRAPPAGPGGGKPISRP